MGRRCWARCGFSITVWIVDVCMPLVRTSLFAFSLSSRRQFRAHVRYSSRIQQQKIAGMVGIGGASILEILFGFAEMMSALWLGTRSRHLFAAGLRRSRNVFGYPLTNNQRAVIIIIGNRVAFNMTEVTCELTLSENFRLWELYALKKWKLLERFDKTWIYHVSQSTSNLSVQPWK